jgi:RNA polymerase sigma factor (sigma-70 family)
MKGAIGEERLYERFRALGDSSLEMPEPLRVVTNEGVRVGRADEHASFEAFFEGQAPTLFRRLYLITGDVSEAEDIMQEAFIVIFERWDRVRRMDDPEGYLYKVAFNSQKKRSRRAALMLRRTIRMAPAPDDFAAVEDRTMVSAALASLTPRQRTALVLTELLGFPSDEAAAIMNVRPATVRTLAHQGRKAMREAGERG